MFIKLQNKGRVLNFVYETMTGQLRILYLPIFSFQVSMPTLHSLFYGKKMGPRIPDTRSGDTMNNTVSTVCSEKKRSPSRPLVLSIRRETKADSRICAQPMPVLTNIAR